MKSAGRNVEDSNKHYFMNVPKRYTNFIHISIVTTYMYFMAYK
jgi:hypothetical protein